MMSLFSQADYSENEGCQETATETSSLLCGKIAHGFGGQKRLTQLVVLNGTGQGLDDSPCTPEQRRARRIVPLA